MEWVDFQKNPPKWTGMENLNWNLDFERAMEDRRPYYTQKFEPCHTIIL